MPAYYNEIEPFAAEWLRALIKRKMIPDGEVDERSIVDVSPDDLIGFHQCHFFAGIGGWPYALRLAGWDDDREVWSGSAPCQSISSAGKGGMHTDDWRKLRTNAENPVVDPRHLWPAFYRLIEARKPAAVFGEQVGKRAGIDWLTAVRADLEDGGYAVGAADLPACSVGAPHIRQRVFWVGVRVGGRAGMGDAAVQRRGSQRQLDDAAVRTDGAAGAAGVVDRLADSDRQRHNRLRLLQWAERSAVPEAAGSGGASRLAHGDIVSGGQGREDERGGAARGETKSWPRPGGSFSPGRLGDGRDPRLPIRQLEAAIREGRREEGRATTESGETAHRLRRPSADHGGWGAVDWIRCRDAKWRPAQYGILPLADGLPKRMGRLRAGSIRGYGNAIVPGVAKVFIEATMEWVGGAELDP